DPSIRDVANEICDQFLTRYQTELKGKSAIRTSQFEGFTKWLDQKIEMPSSEDLLPLMEVKASIFEKIKQKLFG
ncbi:MAG: hypothetical protein ACXAD7_19180, partial [Candidatus Kariarchaeaceae archaeon]